MPLLTKPPKLHRTIYYYDINTKPKPAQIIRVIDNNTVDLRLSGSNVIVRGVKRLRGRNHTQVWTYSRKSAPNKYVGKTAEALWRADTYNAGLAPQWLKDLSGNGHHMRLGSVGRADVIDGALVLNGVNGNYASTPDHAALDTFADLEVIVKAAADNWTPSVIQVFDGKWNGSGGDASWTFYLNINGTLELATRPTAGGVNVIGTSTVATGLADGATKWLKATLDGDDGSGNRAYNFYLSDDGVAWTQLGTTVITAGTTSIGNSTALLTVGSNNEIGNHFAGRIYRAIVKNGITDEPTTNLITNPSVEVDASGYTTPFNANNTGARDVTDKYVGTASFKANRIGAYGDTRFARYNIGVQAVGTYTFSARIKPDAALGNVYVQAMPDTAVVNNTTIVGGAVAGQWQRIYVTYNVTTAGALYFDFFSNANVGSCFIDALQVEAKSAPTTYCDGSLGGTCSWTGTAHASTSVRVAATTVFDADFSTQSDGVPWFNDATGKRIDIFPKRAAVVGGELYLTGLTGQYAFTNDQVVAFGDVEIQATVRHDTWVPAGGGADFIGGYDQGSAGKRGVFLYLNSAGLLNVYWSADGTNLLNAVATVTLTAAGLPTNRLIELRATLDVNNGAGGNTANFYWREVGASTWIQIGTAVTQAGVTSIYAVTARPFTVGADDNTAHSGTDHLAGRINRFRMLNGINGPTVFDCDFSTWNDGEGVDVPKQLDTGQFVKVVTDTTGADTNDPTWLPYKGEKYVYFPAVAANNLTSPNTTVLNAGNDRDWRFKVALDDWTLGSAQCIASHWNGGTDRGWSIRVETTGALYLSISPNGAAETAYTSPALIVLDGQALTLRITRIAATGEVNMYSSTDYNKSTGQGTWTLLFNVMNGASDIWDVAGGPLTLGERGDGVLRMQGKLYWFEMYNGVNGTKVFDFDASKLSENYTRILLTDSKNLLSGEHSDHETGGAGITTGDSGNINVLSASGGIEGTLDIALSRKTTTGNLDATNYYDAGYAGAAVSGIRRVEVTPGVTYTSQAVLKAGATGRRFKVDMVWWSASGTTGSPSIGTNTFCASGVETLLTVTGVAPAGAIAVTMSVYTMDADVPVGETHYTGKWQTEVGSVATAWVRGKTYIYLNRSSTGKKLAVVDRPMFLFGTDDYMECADHAALDFSTNEYFRASIASRTYSRTVSNLVLISKIVAIGGGAGGWLLYANPDFVNHAYIDNFNYGYNGGPSGIPAPGEARTFTGGRDSSGMVSQVDSEAEARGGGVGSITTASLVNAMPVRIGSVGNSGPGAAIAMEFMAASIHRSALAAADVAALNTEFGSAW